MNIPDMELVLAGFLPDGLTKNGMLGDLRHDSCFNSMEDLFDAAETVTDEDRLRDWNTSYE